MAFFYQNITILQRSLCGRAAVFRLKVRGERLKARSFYRFALNYFYVVRALRAGGCYSCYSCASRTSSTRGGGAAGIKRQFKSILFVNYCHFFPFCGLEECAMHIDNPQMRGMFFCGVTRHVCRGYDRLRILGGLPPKCTPRAKHTEGGAVYFIEKD